MNDASNSDWTEVGLHRVRFEPPDLILGHMVGSIDLAQSNAVWDAVWPWVKDLPDIYWIGDISKLEHYSGTAVRGSNSHGWSIMKKMRVIGCIGGNYRQRTSMSLIAKALELLGSVAQLPRIAFFDNETEARAFIEQARKCRQERLS